MPGTPDDPVRLSPFQRIVALRVTNDVEFLITEAHFFTNGAEDTFQSSEAFDAGEVLPDPPSDYGRGWMTSRTTKVAFTGRLYNAPTSLFDAEGDFIGISEDVAITPPPMPVTSAFGEFELVAQNEVKALVGGTVPLFTQYKTISAPGGFYGGSTFGGGGNFHVGSGGTMAAEYRQIIPSDNVYQVNILPSAASYQGHSFAVIGAKATGPVVGGGGTVGLSLSVLMKRQS